MRTQILMCALAALFGGVLAACGDPGECGARSSCRTNPTIEARDMTARALLASPTGIAATAAPEPTRPPVVVGTATPEPPTSVPPPAALAPTFMPPDPSQVTPRPTDLPFTPHPRPRMPAASDIHAGADGRYVADVDGCHWSEFGRFPVANSSDIDVGMQTPCLPLEGLHFNPRTGEIDYFIV